ncbi:myosin light chain kinase, smooth muscle-like [Lineus longissimus]|uniref:myosin light chain kinase, smooth muscle-like n=1 Tax=Lineus longissimus TaxID=88925 RepID=UPI00315CC562
MVSVPMFAIYFLILVCSNICNTSAEEKEVKVHIGDTALLRCDVTSDTDRQVFWIKEGPRGQELISIGSILFTQAEKYDVTVTGNQFVLAISDAVDPDAGTYRCQTTEARAIASFKVVVEAREKVIRIRSGRTAKLPCHVTGTLGTQTIVWKKKGSPAPVTVGLFTFDQDPDMYVTVTGGKWTLVIRNAEAENAGTYQCQIRARAGDVRVLASIKLVVEEEEKRNTIIVAERQQGSSATLRCNLETLTTPLEQSKVTWVKVMVKSNFRVIIASGSKIFFTDDKYDLSVIDDMSTLTINDADQSDERTYLCQVKDPNRCNVFECFCF